MYGNIFEGLLKAMIIILIVITIIIGGVFFLMGKNNGTKIESKTRIVPTWKLVTDGKKVDTIFIYKIKK